MTPELRATIEDAYRIFGGYTVRRSLSVCHCNSCMSEETEHELLTTPLREIPYKLLAEYTDSAHDWDDGPVAHQMRYFLPRYFELIAINDSPFAMDIDICLRRLADASWREKWPKAEENIIDRFFDDIVRSYVAKLSLVQWPVGWRLEFDLTDVLTMIATARGDIDRALAVWDASNDPAAAIQMAAMRQRVLMETARTYLHSVYLEDDPVAADKIGAFLMRPEVDERMERAFFDIDDPRLQQLVSDAIYPRATNPASK
jgi:hypothetical protein